MRKITAVILAAFILAGVLTACSDAPEPGGEDLCIVATIFPAYDWVREILGDRAGDVSLTLLLDSGVDLHNYQPTADDIIKISACDVFIYVGGASDAWVADALQEAANEEMIVISLFDVLGGAVKEEELVEGMEAEADEDGSEADEHVWLSLRNAETVCGYIAEALGTADPDNAAAYEDNAAAYIEKLDALDARYAAAAAAGGTDTLLFGDRFPFRYLADDYGLSYYAAFSGCSAETEASFETVAFLAQKLDELGLSCVMTIEGTDHRIAETIIASTETGDQAILELDSMQGTTAADVQAGATYLSIMEDNLAVLTEALR